MSEIDDLRARVAELEARLAAPKGPLVSPLAVDLPDLPAVAGVRFATARAGVKYAGRTDVMLCVCDPGTVVAGTLTRSATASGAVEDCRAKLGHGGPDGWAIVVNSGNANAFTGRNGARSVQAVVQAASKATGVPGGHVLTSSTGVIGEPMAHERIVAVLDDCAAALSPGGMADAARAIMTTDTYPKGAVRTVDMDGATVTVAGIAKGSGMIAPDMATMLAYVFTDAAVTREALQAMVSASVDATFNAVSVDTDTSTSDTLIVAATGKAGNAPVEAPDGPLAEALHAVLHDLALQIVRDGEGATKLIEARVTGAHDAADARRVAKAIVDSPLVKTAVAGEDANWGRVVMAVGKSGARADRDRLSIRFGDLEVARDGVRAEGYDEAAATAHVRGEHVVIAVDLGLGDGAATAYGCDLTYRYVEINADYRS
ncbi:bifunctional glutamate N-acetyltransferase/amino-acid acetyltransferase ArgJ [Jannaschia sp. Os4]|uniref:bifunctional glutamate N-acetyltransferase/amino-acid acetyltransferase ArgJ n=1 Tax=Jannaschia sp. Os4 TaxID=2807617 RepID=UPI00193ADB6A|nr:bifunctional glutamate N-acetyltransferase/amino-acid acetyltransferase ArgJ [Jannaschia sp. Os4]MBM2575184.1 bifunctional glutamate N-acetyltransferase/amino-acid acetyltransferase ArgJ [Jannaschia sp. Os4]